MATPTRFSFTQGMWSVFPAALSLLQKKNLNEDSDAAT